MNAIERIDTLKDTVKTPCYIYDRDAIRENARAFRDAFSWAPGFRDYYAVKACPNVTIMKLLHDEGYGFDCASLPEIMLAQAAGARGHEIMFSSNDTPDDEFVAALQAGAIVNLDDITFIDHLESVPDTICFRYNPGPERTGNAIIGDPVEAKYGVTSDQIVDCYRIMKRKGTKHFALHTMVASNELDGSYIVETARMLFSLVKRIRDEAGVRIELVDLGGGIGIPYKPKDKPMDIQAVSQGIHDLYQSMIVKEGLAPLKIAFECGRYITGPYGYLLSRVLHVTRKYKDFVGLDACMADLMRPGMYGAYHAITVLGKESLPKDHLYDVTGSLCENNDKFAINRQLPVIQEGDFLVIHNGGAHAYSMGFNYNGKLRHAEYLLEPDGSLTMIRRAETYDDYVATLRFDGAPVEV